MTTYYVVEHGGDVIAASGYQDDVSPKGALSISDDDVMTVWPPELWVKYTTDLRVAKQWGYREEEPK